MTPEHGSKGRALILAAQPLASALARELEAAGIAVVVHDRPDGALRAMFDTAPALVVMADPLGEVSGLRVLQGVREVADTPVFMIGHDDDETRVVEALHAGADDYMVVPLRLREFRARAETLARRRGDDRPRPKYRDGLIEVDFENVRVTVADNDLELTPVEYRLLVAFVQHPNQVLSVPQLLERVWDDPAAPRARVKLYVGYLRDKLRTAGTATAIQTVRGFGYRFVPPPAATDVILAVELLDAQLQAELEQLRGPKGQPFFPNEAARRELAEALARA